jgi:hypothetical protein
MMMPRNMEIYIGETDRPREGSAVGSLCSSKLNFRRIFQRYEYMIILLLGPGVIFGMFIL